MTDMIYRVEQAILRRRMTIGSSGTLSTDRELAVAVIEAMRTPTKAMVNAADMMTGMPEAVWRDMIDAALNEKAGA